MTQQEVLKYLKKHTGKKYTVKQLSKIFNKRSINTNLKKLAKQGEIRRIIDNQAWHFRYLYWF